MIGKTFLVGSASPSLPGSLFIPLPVLLLCSCVLSASWILQACSLFSWCYFHLLFLCLLCWQSSISGTGYFFSAKMLSVEQGSPWPKVAPLLTLTSSHSSICCSLKLSHPFFIYVVITLLSPTLTYMLLWVVKVKVKSLSRVQLFATPWTVAYDAPLSLGFSRQEYWSGSPCPSPEDLPNPGIEPGSPTL